MQRSGTASNPDRCHPIIACSAGATRRSVDTLPCSPQAGYRAQAVESDHQVAAPMAGANHVCGGRRWVPGRLGGWSSVGGVHCWGSDEPQNQQLGFNTSPANSASSPRQADYGDGNSASSSVLLAAGWNHNLVKISDRLFCFGANDELQCGQAWGATVSSPRQVEGLVVSYVGAAGESHSCVMTSDDAVRCWGMNDRGQLGRGASGPSTASSDVVVSLAGNAN